MGQNAQKEGIRHLEIFALFQELREVGILGLLRR
jgi:hypothetical protein